MRILLPRILFLLVGLHLVAQGLDDNADLLQLKDLQVDPDLNMNPDLTIDPDPTADPDEATSSDSDIEIVDKIIARLDHRENSTPSTCEEACLPSSIVDGFNNGNNTYSCLCECWDDRETCSSCVSLAVQHSLRWPNVPKAVQLEMSVRDSLICILQPEEIDKIMDSISAHAICLSEAFSPLRDDQIEPLLREVLTAEALSLVDRGDIQPELADAAKDAFMDAVIANGKDRAKMLTLRLIREDSSLVVTHLSEDADGKLIVSDSDQADVRHLAHQMKAVEAMCNSEQDPQLDTGVDAEGLVQLVEHTVDTEEVDEKCKDAIESMDLHRWVSMYVRSASSGCGKIMDHGLTDDALSLLEERHYQKAALHVIFANSGGERSNGSLVLTKAELAKSRALQHPKLSSRACSDFEDMMQGEAFASIKSRNDVLDYKSCLCEHKHLPNMCMAMHEDVLHDIEKVVTEALAAQGSGPPSLIQEATNMNESSKTAGLSPCKQPVQCKACAGTSGNMFCADTGMQNFHRLNEVFIGFVAGGGDTSVFTNIMSDPPCFSASCDACMRFEEKELVTLRVRVALDETCFVLGRFPAAFEFQKLLLSVSISPLLSLDNKLFGVVGIPTDYYIGTSRFFPGFGKISHDYSVSVGLFRILVDGVQRTGPGAARRFLQRRLNEGLKSCGCQFIKLCPAACTLKAMNFLNVYIKGILAIDKDFDAPESSRVRLQMWQVYAKWEKECTNVWPFGKVCADLLKVGSHYKTISQWV